MSGHLCLKWNNHSASFLKSISNIQLKERYCDATITCQGKYFPVHRIVLSTCSDYFEEMFERIQNQHPYIVFKDIDPREMELLLNYMYQGEVNVLQEHLPTLIKAAEALKIKGLAVPDDLPPKDHAPGRKRSNTFSDNPQSKRRMDERRRRGDSTENNDKQISTSEDILKHSSGSNDLDPANEPKIIKEEPLDTGYEDNNFPSTVTSDISESQNLGTSETEFINFNETENSTYIKNENSTQDESYENKPSTWGESQYEIDDQLGGHSTTNVQDDIFDPIPVDLNASKNATSNSKTNDLIRGSTSLGLYPRYAHPARSKNSSNKRENLPKLFSCSLCPLRFGNRANLRRHLLIHTGEKPFQCPYCAKTFNQKVNLKYHMNKKIKCYS